MRCIFTGYTDKGKRKKNNQDSMLIRGKENLDGQKALLAVICDGMGGFEQGELASREAVRLFSEWLDMEFPKIGNAEDTETFEDTLYESWEILFQTVHQMIRSYGELHRIRLGTTATVILMIKGRYYTAHVGDSRIYEIRKGVIRQLTQDQNVANVSLPDEQYVTRAGEKKKSSSILLQGIGASKAVRPVYDSGELQYNAVYLLCSDGFRNKTGEDELAGRFDPGKIATGEAMKLQAEEFIQILRGRGERDDITVLLIRTMDVQN